MGLFKLFKELVFPSIPSSSNDEFLDSMKKNENSNDNIDNQSEELKGKVENQKEKEKEKENFIHPRRLFPKKHVHPHGYVQFSAGMDPYTITNLNPTIKDCIKIFGTYEYGIILLTGYIPAYLVYRDHRNLKRGGVWIGALVGLGAGFIYGLMHSYSRLVGFMPFDTNNVQWITDYDISKENYYNDNNNGK